MVFMRNLDERAELQSCRKTVCVCVVLPHSYVFCGAKALKHHNYTKGGGDGEELA